MRSSGKKRKAFPAWVAEHWPDAVMIADAAGVIEYVNPAFEALTGYSAAEVVGKTPALLKSGKHDARFYRRMWRTLRAGKAFRGIFLNRRKSGELFHEEEIIRPVRGPGARVAYFVSSGRDVTQQVRRVAKLERDATHDGLTRLPNRVLFADRLAHALRQAARRKEGFVLAMFDLDGFREANNRFGHLAGDAVLRAVAKRTARCIRKADTVARVGGDEFALILSGAAQRGAEAVLEKLRAANARPVRFEGHSIPLSVSIGACFYPGDGRSEKALRKGADAAMYAAKRAGGNRWRFALAVRGSSLPGRQRSSRARLKNRR